VEQALDRLESSGARVLKAVKKVREHPAWMLARRGDRLEPFLEGPVKRRQDLPELFIPCGALYLYRAAYLESPADPEPCGWIELGWPESLDIDEPDDLALARWVVEHRRSGARRER
jgi:CMP-N-acetylneuraminic acid synthetase